MRVSRLIALSTLALLPAFAAAQSSALPTTTPQTPAAVAQSSDPFMAPGPSAAMDAQINAKLREQLQRQRGHTEWALRAGHSNLISPQRCYTLRDYNFTSDQSGSDATHLSSQSACESASNFHLKSAR